MDIEEAYEKLMLVPGEPLTEEQINSAYRIRSKYYTHPDTPGGDSKIFQEVEAARGVLIDGLNNGKIKRGEAELDKGYKGTGERVDNPEEKKGQHFDSKTFHK